MKEEIFKLIERIQTERQNNHIEPHHVLLAEIINDGFHSPQRDINQLVGEGRLKWCRTLNDLAFTIINKTIEE